MTISTRKQQAMHKARKQAAHHHARKASTAIIDRELDQIMLNPDAPTDEPERIAAFTYDPQIWDVEIPEAIHLNVYYSCTPVAKVQQARITYKRRKI